MTRIALIAVVLSSMMLSATDCPPPDAMDIANLFRQATTIRTCGWFIRYKLVSEIQGDNSSSVYEVTLSKGKARRHYILRSERTTWEKDSYRLAVEEVKP